VASSIEGETKPRRRHIIQAYFSTEKMDANIIAEDFRRATKDARSNWIQVERSLDQIMKSAKSNTQIQAQVIYFTIYI